MIGLLTMLHFVKEFSRKIRNLYNEFKEGTEWTRFYLPKKEPSDKLVYLNKLVKEADEDSDPTQMWFFNKYCGDCGYFIFWRLDFSF